MDRARTPDFVNGFFSKGGHWVALQTAILAGIAIGAPAAGRTAEAPLQLASAALLLAAGTVFFAGGSMQLHRHLTVFTRPVEGAPLVRNGLYRIVRHPIYTGVLLIALGWSILWTCPAAAAATLPLALVLLRKATLEERFLRHRFPEYESYSREVRWRLVPRLL